MIIDCISDLHGFYPKLEGGDLLIVAGDLTAHDEVEEYIYFREWLSKQNYRKRIIVAGNHDNKLELDYKFGSIPFLEIADYLCDSDTEFVLEYPKLEPCFSQKDEKIYKRKVLKIWGSPWTKTFEGMNPQCKAFTCETEEELAEKWALIPDDIDILITHSPPYGILDEVKEVTKSGTKTFNVGSKSLALKIGKMEKPPKLWVWGHIHESYGEDLPVRSKPCKMLNASIMNERYEPVNKPIRVIL